MVSITIKTTFSPVSASTFLPETTSTSEATAWGVRKSKTPPTKAKGNIRNGVTLSEGNRPSLLSRFLAFQRDIQDRALLHPSPVPFPARSNV